jgi:hypothetical protein
MYAKLFLPFVATSLTSFQIPLPKDIFTRTDTAIVFHAQKYENDATQLDVARLRASPLNSFSISSAIDMPTTSSSKVLAFVPIIKISNDLDSCKNALEVAQMKISDSTVAKASLLLVKEVLSSSTYDTASFKKAFNRYSDNIVIPGGQSSATPNTVSPSSAQTQMYLLRNNILTSVQNTREDIADGLKSSAITEEDVEDALSDLSEAIASLQDYIGLSDPDDVQMAKDIVRSSRSESK